MVSHYDFDCMSQIVNEVKYARFPQISKTVKIKASLLGSLRKVGALDVIMQLFPSPGRRCELGVIHLPVLSAMSRYGEFNNKTLFLSALMCLDYMKSYRHFEISKEKMRPLSSPGKGGMLASVQVQDVVQLCLFAIPWTEVHQALLSSTSS